MNVFGGGRAWLSMMTRLPLHPLKEIDGDGSHDGSCRPRLMGRLRVPQCLLAATSWVDEGIGYSLKVVSKADSRVDAFAASPIGSPSLETKLTSIVLSSRSKPTTSSSGSFLWVRMKLGRVFCDCWKDMSAERKVMCLHRGAGLWQ